MRKVNVMVVTVRGSRLEEFNAFLAKGGVEVIAMTETTETSPPNNYYSFVLRWTVYTDTGQRHSRASTSLNDPEHCHGGDVRERFQPNGSFK